MAESFLRHFDDGVIDGAIFNALASAGGVTLRRVDDTDLVQVINRPALTEMDAGSTTDTLFS
jgi:hypothetical protein